MRVNPAPIIMLMENTEVRCIIDPSTEEEQLRVVLLMGQANSALMKKNAPVLHCETSKLHGHG